MLHIMTLHWNNVDKIKRLYESFNFTDYKWWIKDNGSTDGSKEYLDSIANDNIDVYYCGHNRDSFAKGMNTIFKRIDYKDGDNILLLNNDVYFSSDNSIEKMISCLKDDVGIVGARILYPGSNLLQHGGVEFPDNYGGLPRHFRHKEKSTKSDEIVKMMPAVTGAVMLMRASDYEKYGMLDEGFVWAFEDIDLCLKVGRDKKVIYCGETEIYHEESASLKVNPINNLMFSNNKKYFIKKWAARVPIKAFKIG